LLAVILSNFTPRGARNLILVGTVITNVACGNEGNEQAPLTFPAVDAVVEVPRTHQSIRGFGASSAWTLPAVTDDLADQLFSAEQGIGLSLLRLRIAPSGQSGELVTAQKAAARGATVWAAPWSPPGEWKDNGDAQNGGSLLPEHYQDWADRLAAFVASAAEEDVPLAMLSAQNEPNWKASWETCLWSPSTLTRFVAEHLGPAVDALGLGTRVLAPETQDWRTLEEYALPLLEDPVASEYVGAIAVHDYGSDDPNPVLPLAGKDLWVTELDDKLDGDPDGLPYDPGMGSGLKVARKLYEDLVVRSVNAWHYWWLAPRGDQGPTNGALTDGTALTRRAYVMGNYSRFVRPGFVRVEATGSPLTHVLIAAFRDDPATRLVIVATNGLGTAHTQRFLLDGAELGSVSPWITSDELALEEQPAEPIVDGAFTFTLPARSVTTFVADLGEVYEPEPEPEQPWRVPPREVSNESGCSCEVAGRRQAANGALAAFLGLTALAGSRRRRATSRKRS
jgi:glucuronoarabinoxylan endo-1,4-beta-xylanase